MDYSRDEMLRAVANPAWQQFRLSLKGISTREKLAKLWHYFNSSQDKDKDGIRVDNYLKALCRGGQLYSGESLESFLAVQGQLSIKRER